MMQTNLPSTSLRFEISKRLSCDPIQSLLQFSSNSFWGWFGGNFNDSFLKFLNTFNMIVLETVSYIFLGVAMMRLEPAMKIEIIISFSRCLIRANVHISQGNRDWKLNPH